MVSLEKDSDNGLAGAIDRILDKGLVINADITVSVAGVELRGIQKNKKGKLIRFFILPA
jgi:hypothetical protein